MRTWRDRDVLERTRIHINIYTTIIISCLKNFWYQQKIGRTFSSLLLIFCILDCRFLIDGISDQMEQEKISKGA
jgi:hypothetical protein